ncbi:MAG: hypothetical protein ACP5I6_07290 [Caldisphaera sp.]
MFKELAKNIMDSFNSELNAFIMDKKIVDIKNLKSLINRSGIEKIVEIKEIDKSDIVVLLISESIIEKNCLYEKCSNINDRLEKKTCVKKCVEDNFSFLKKEIEKSLEEATNILDLPS